MKAIEASQEKRFFGAKVFVSVHDGLGKACFIHSVVAQLLSPSRLLSFAVFSLYSRVLFNWRGEMILVVVTEVFCHC